MRLVLNPVAWLELRVRAREERLWILVAFSMIAYLIPCILVCATTPYPSSTIVSDPIRFASAFQYSLLCVQLGLVGVLAPLSAAGRISQEREQRTSIAMRNSPATPSQIALGKLLGALPFLGWLIVLPFPLLVVGWMWGGMTLWSLTKCVLANTACGITITIMALGASSLFSRSLTSYLVTGALLFSWAVLCPLTGVLLMSITHEHSADSIIGYLTFYHHPVYPLVAALEDDETNRAAFTQGKVLYCLAVWMLIGAVSFATAVLGVRREIE